MENIKTTEILEEEIIYNLIENSEYFTSVIPYLEDQHFSEIGNKNIFNTIKEYYAKTGRKPNLKETVVLLKDLKRQIRIKSSESLKNILNSKSHINDELLIEATEDFIKKAMHTKALILGAEAMSENNKDKLSESYAIAEEAQKFTLNTDFGTEIEDIEKSVKEYNDNENCLITTIKSFDKMIGHGFKNKTLNVFLAPPGIGKSAALADFATRFVLQQENVIIFTLEMSESEWMKRIYANILNIDIALIENVDIEVLKDRFNNLKNKIGKLVIKEFPSYTVNPLHLSNFIEKYSLKKDIKNPVIIVDYLGLLNSSRLPASTQSYEYVKSITAELRSVAQKLELKIFTAHQLNRSAIGNLEAGQEAVSDSAGISMFSDTMMFLLQTKEMKNKGEIIVNFEKNRLSGKTYSFRIGFSYSKMRFEDRFKEEEIDELGLVKDDTLLI